MHGTVYVKGIIFARGRLLAPFSIFYPVPAPSGTNSFRLHASSDSRKISHEHRAARQHAVHSRGPIDTGGHEHKLIRLENFRKLLPGAATDSAIENLEPLGSKARHAMHTTALITGRGSRRGHGQRDNPDPRSMYTPPRPADSEQPRTRVTRCVESEFSRHETGSPPTETPRMENLRAATPRADINPRGPGPTTPPAPSIRAQTLREARSGSID